MRRHFAVVEQRPVQAADRVGEDADEQHEHDEHRLRVCRCGDHSDERQRGKHQRPEQDGHLRYAVAEKAAADAADGRIHSERRDEAGRRCAESEIAFVQVRGEAGRPEHLIAAEHDRGDEPQFGDRRECLQVGQHVALGASRRCAVARVRRILHEREQHAERDAEKRVQVDDELEAGCIGAAARLRHRRTA